jgi:hypothetical protein
MGVGSMLNLSMIGTYAILTIIALSFFVVIGVCAYWVWELIAMDRAETPQPTLAPRPRWRERLAFRHHHHGDGYARV